MAHQEIGMELLKRVESDLESMANVEQLIFIQFYDMLEML